MLIVSNVTVCTYKAAYQHIFSSTSIDIFFLNISIDKFQWFLTSYVLPVHLLLDDTQFSCMFEKKKMLLDTCLICYSMYVLHIYVRLYCIFCP